MAILKDTLLRDTNGQIVLPAGTTAQRPLRPPNGAMRFNTTLGISEVYYNNAWYDFSNGDVLLDVPPSTLDSNGYFVELWGAGGAGGTVGGWTYGAAGGGGGYTWGWLQGLTSGESLILQVGGAGAVNSSSMAFGGGGQANRTGSDNRYGSGGGGYTGLFRGSVTQANAILIAGGGGGGGSSRNNTGNVGGGGGGRIGRDGVSAYDGKDGYRGRGGSMYQTGNTAQASSDSQNTDYQGQALAGGTCRVNGYGGAGGGGYWGGSAGGYSEQHTMAGGGGGSGYLHPTLVVGGGSIPGAWQAPPYPPSGSLGYGGAVATAGNNGFARITRNGVATTYNYTGSNVTITYTP